MYEKLRNATIPAATVAAAERTREHHRGVERCDDFGCDVHELVLLEVMGFRATQRAHGAAYGTLRLSGFSTRFSRSWPAPWSLGPVLGQRPPAADIVYDDTGRTSGCAPHEALRQTDGGRRPFVPGGTRLDLGAARAQWRWQDHNAVVPRGPASARRRGARA